MHARGSSPARSASESPRRRKPREASATYGDLSETASASVCGARVFSIAASRMQVIGAGFFLRRSRDRQYLGRYFRGWRPPEAKGRPCGLGATERRPRHCGFQQHVPAHDVSIQMIATEGCWCRGCVPRLKISMTIMRPPQEGQSGGTVSVRLVLAEVCLLLHRRRRRIEQLTQSRDIAGAACIGEQP